MDLEALQELLAQLSGEDGFERGRTYSTKISEEEVIRILGELPLPGAVLAVKVSIVENSDSQYLSLPVNCNASLEVSVTHKKGDDLMKVIEGVNGKAFGFMIARLPRKKSTS